MRGLRTVAIFLTLQEAATFRELLERFEIRAIVLDRGWLGSEASGGVPVEVAAEDFERARQLLADVDAFRRERRLKRQAKRISFSCEDCGGSITVSGDRCGFVETCPHCRCYVDVPEWDED